LKWARASLGILARQQVILPLSSFKKDRDARPKTLLQQLAASPGSLFSGSFRQQVAALCYRILLDSGEIEILVVTSRESGRWVIPKGWPMKNKELYEAAAIEALQEAGVRGAVRKKAIGSYTYLKTLDDGEVLPCIVDVFQIEVKETLQKFKEEGDRRLAWVSPDEAARRVREVELKSLIIEFMPR
jgi:8-oxo-dGTP pyrophosphatase MutT (NUDIX family)